MLASPPFCRSGVAFANSFSSGAACHIRNVWPRFGPPLCGAYLARPAAPAQGVQEELVSDSSGDGHDPWAVYVSQEESRAGLLRDDTVAKSLDMLEENGFVIWRGGSLFNDEELKDAQAAADRELLRVKMQIDDLGLVARAPWLGSTDEFMFKEAMSYTCGRLDLPTMIHTTPFNEKPWRNNTNLIAICEGIFEQPCEQAVFGALWNFPRSSDTYWHRDGPQSFLVAVTAAFDYPAEVGFIHVQPFTHLELSDSDQAPQPERGEAPAVPVVLRRGETVLFFYTTKHAATPNFSPLERCLLYSVYGVAGERDDLNHKSRYPSLYGLSKAAASDLDSIYEEMELDGPDSYELLALEEGHTQ